MYPVLSLLAGICNRLGDGKSQPIVIQPPGFLNRKRVADVKADIELARDTFREYVSMTQGSRSGGA